MRLIPSALQIILCLAILTGPQQAEALPGSKAGQARLAADRAFFGFSMALDTLVDGTRGIRVMQLVPGGPAEEAGLQVGDLILAVDHQHIRFETPVDMIRGLDRYKAGQRLDLEVLRGDSTSHRTLLAGETSRTDREQLEAWLANVEASGGYSPERSANCAAVPDPEIDEAFRSAERWRELVRRIAQAEGHTELTVMRQKTGATPQILFDTPGLEDVGLTFADLPADMRESSNRLEPGGSMRYRISASENHFVIDSLSP